jgi:hypothetical protein
MPQRLRPSTRRQVGEEDHAGGGRPVPKKAQAEARRRAARSKALRRGARREVLLQSLETIGREARVLARRLRTLSDTDAPVAAVDDAFFR